MNGTIRCIEHMHPMHKTDRLGDAIVLESDFCDCYEAIPLAWFSNIQDGGNFTHVFTTSANRLRAFRKEHADMLRHVSNGQSFDKKTGLYHLVF